MQKRWLAARRAWLRSFLVPGFALAASVLSGCAGLLRPDMPPVDPEAFAVPANCRADMRIEDNVLSCGRGLMAVARDFGQAANTRLETVLDQDLALPHQVERVHEVKAMIADHCLEAAPEKIALYDEGEPRQAVEESVAPLSRCVFYAGKVMRRFDAADQAEALDWAVQRLTYAVNAHDPFLGPPRDYDLGPMEPRAGKDESALSRPGVT